MANRRCSQSGVSLTGLLFWSVVLGGAALIVMRLFPLYNEKMKVDDALSLAANSPQVATMGKAELARAIMRQFEVSDVDRWTSEQFSRELVVERTPQGRRMALAYDIRGTLCCDLDLVLKYNREFTLPRAPNDF